jgi:hypothetical protein
MAKKKGGKGRRPPSRSGNQRPGGQRPGGQKAGGGQKTGSQPSGQKAAGTSKSASATEHHGAEMPAPAKKAAPAQKARGAASASGAGRARPRNGPTRAERLAAAESARRRKARRTKMILLTVIALAVAGILALVSGNRKATADVKKQLQAGSCRYDTESDGDNGTGNNHVANPTYKVNPPAGGNHLATPANPGTYTEQNLPPDGEIVHSMEHGYVVLWYQPSLDPKALDPLFKVADKYQRDVLVVPRPSLPKPVAATAWHHRLLCGDVDAKALDLFVRTYRNQGPEKIPH